MPVGADDSHDREQRPVESAEPASNSARLVLPWRWLLVGLVVFMLAGWSVQRWRAHRDWRRQQDVAARLTSLGGEARFWENAVVQVTFTGAELGREAATNLSELPRLRRLVVIDATIADEALEGIATQLPALRELVLINVPLGDRGLAHVGRCRELSQLQLYQAGVTDEGLVHVKDLRALTRLDLQGDGITDKGLEHLAGLAALEQIHLTGTLVTPEGIRTLQLALPKTDIRS